jgi:hypothetical protein
MTNTTLQNASGPLRHVRVVFGEVECIESGDDHALI